MTVTALPLTNARGHPWTSRGARNLACAGSALGNGGVTPPGTYQRRRGCIGPDERHDGFWRHDWRIVLAHARDQQLISPNAYAVGSHLVDRSDDKAHHAYPSQAFLGGRMDRSASTAHRALAELRRVGVLEWDHRFEGPTNDNPRPHPTSNLYECRFPVELVTAAGLKMRLQRLGGPTAPRRRKPRAGSTHPKAPTPPLSAAERDRRQRQRAAEAVVAGAALLRDATFDGVCDEISRMYVDDPELANFALDYLSTVWKRRGGP